VRQGPVSPSLVDVRVPYVTAGELAAIKYSLMGTAAKCSALGKEGDIGKRAEYVCRRT
jgi:hypothetical protein